MKEVFVDKAFSGDKLGAIQEAENICSTQAAKGYRLSLRQLYYQFVSHALLEKYPSVFKPDPSTGSHNNERNYKTLGVLVSDARNAGLIDWSHIEDRGRSVKVLGHWDTPSEILRSAAWSFRLDLWQGQENYVLVMVEKDAMAGILEPVCNRLDVPFCANKGYGSDSLFYGIGRDLQRRAVKEKRHAHVIYLGDHDPSGMDMTRDVQERLERYARLPVTMHRVALNIEQVEEYQPPENPTKLTDSRSTGYISTMEEYGYRYDEPSDYPCWELDALDPEVIESCVKDIVTELRDEEKYSERLKQQQGWRDDLELLAARFSKGVRLEDGKADPRIAEIAELMQRYYDDKLDTGDLAMELESIFPHNRES